MSNLCELCGKEAMGGTYQMRTGLLNICSECSGLYVERLDAVVATAWASEIAKIKTENGQAIKTNIADVLTTQKQKLVDEIAAIDVRIADVSKPVEVIK